MAIKNISKYYEEQLALDEINFKVNSGEIVGFLGPNGAGKSTTMKIISCFIKPSKGEVLVDGDSIHNNEIKVKSKIGYLPCNSKINVISWVGPFTFTTIYFSCYKAPYKINH